MYSYKALQLFLEQDEVNSTLESSKKKMMDHIKKISDVRKQIEQLNDKIEQEQENRRKLRFKKSKTSMLNSKAKDSLQSQIDSSIEKEEDYQTDRAYLIKKSKDMMKAAMKDLEEYRKLKAKESDDKSKEADKNKG